MVNDRICCLSSTIWVKVITTTEIILGTISIMYQISIWRHHHNSVYNKEEDSKGRASLKFVVSFIGFIMNLILLYGVIKKIPLYLYAWLVTGGVLTIIYIWVETFWALLYVSVGVHRNFLYFYAVAQTVYRFFWSFVVLSLVSKFQVESIQEGGPTIMVVPGYGGGPKHFEPLYGGTVIRPFDPHLSILQHQQSSANQFSPNAFH